MTRHPVHVVYGGAQLFKAETPAKLGSRALAALDEYAPNATEFAAAIGLTDVLAEPIYARVREKLGREPVEDYRIDFEDGYGRRSDQDEDNHAAAAAKEVGEAIRRRACPLGIGIRIKPLTQALTERALRTLALFMTTLAGEAKSWPPGFVVTLPKVVRAEQVRSIADALASLEEKLGIANGATGLELMLETPQALVGSDGTLSLPQLIDAAGGRVRSIHFGAYDFLSAYGVSAADQHLRHPFCDLARFMMLTVAAPRSVRVSDGATTVLPVARHRGGGNLTPAQAAENRETVHAAWRRHYEDVRHALRCGIYQGWDLHPGHFPSRFAAVYAFFLEGREPAAHRLRNFVEASGRATRLGERFEDAATVAGLAQFFVQGVDCGAFDEAEISALMGMAPADLRAFHG